MNYQFKNFQKILLPTISVCAFIFFAGEAQAATYYISPTGRSVNTCLADSPCDFATAHNKSDVTTIMVGAGTYALTGNWNITKSITLKGAGRNLTIIDAAAYRVELYTGIVYVKASNVTIEDMTIKNAVSEMILGTDVGSNRAVSVNTSPKAVTTLHDIIIRRVNTTNTWGGGITVQATNNVLVEDCNVSYAMLGRGNTHSWEGGINIKRVNNAIFRRNIVSYCKGEGITSMYVSPAGSNDNLIIEDNITYNVMGANLYFHTSKNVVVRNNIAYHNATVMDQAHYWKPGTCGIGVKVEVDNTGSTGGSGVNATTCLGTNYGYRIYGNVSANMPKGISITSHPDVADYNPDCRLKDILVFNNSIIEPYPTSTAKALAVDGSGALGTGIRVFNNVFWSTDWLLAEILRATGVSIGPNFWNKDPADSYAKHADDPGRVAGVYPTGLSIANYMQKQSGWASIPSGSVTTKDFWKLRSTATYAIDEAAWVATTTSAGSGTVIPVTELPTGHRGYFHTGDIIQFQGQTGTMTVVSSTNSTITVSSARSWNNRVGIGLAYSGTARDNGALEYTSGDTTPPASPSRLLVR